MQEILTQVFSYIWGIWRYRWIALAIAWVLSLAGWAYVYQLPERYQASARIHVDSNTVLRPLLRGVAIQPDIGQRIGLMTRTLLSRPNLEKLMRMTDLDLEVNNEAQKDRMVEDLQQNIGLSGARDNASLYSVSYTHQDRAVAKRVVEALLNVFIESTLGDKRVDSQDAQVFLNKQISDYEQRLIDAEARLTTFKQEHMDIMAGGRDYYQNLSALREQLRNAKLQLREMENRRNELRRQLSGEEPVFWSSSMSDIPELVPLESRIQSLRGKLDNLLTVYTDKHPEVVQIRSLIENLEEEKQEVIMVANSSPSEEGDYQTLKSGTFYQQARAMLAEAEATAAELRVRVEEYQERVTNMEGKVTNVPEIEAQLKQLDRDYGVVQQQYQELLSRRESARISEDVEQNTSDVSFRVIDPPFVPLKPNEPNKPMLYAGVLVIAIGAGCGVAFLLALLHPVITDRRTLAHYTGMPVLGSVMYIPSDKQKKQRFVRGVQFATLFIGLLCVFGAVNFSHLWV